MPGNRHLPGATPHENKQYEAIKEKLEKEGKPSARAKEYAARIVNKQRAQRGETKSKHRHK